VSGIIADPFLYRNPSTVNEKSLAEVVAEAEDDLDEDGIGEEEEEDGEEGDGLIADITIKSDL
jgi:hypothetical protein